MYALRYQGCRTKTSPNLSLRRPSGLPVSLPIRLEGGLARAGRLPRPVAQQIKAAHLNGRMTAAKVEAMAYVTQTALQLDADLTIQEMLLGGMAPQGAGRYRLLVDQFTAAAASQIARMAWEW